MDVYFHDSFYITVVWLHLKDVFKVLIMFHSGSSHQRKNHNTGPHFNSWLGRLIIFRFTSPEFPSRFLGQAWAAAHALRFATLAVFWCCWHRLLYNPSCLVKYTCTNAVPLHSGVYVIGVCVKIDMAILEKGRCVCACMWREKERWRVVVDVCGGGRNAEG